jgi:hypothetical protein
VSNDGIRPHTVEIPIPPDGYSRRGDRDALMGPRGHFVAGGNCSAPVGMAAAVLLALCKTTGTIADDRGGCCAELLEALKDDGRAHSAAGAHGHDADLRVAAAQFVDHRHHHPGAGGRDRVAKTDAAAVDIYY